MDLRVVPEVSCRSVRDSWSKESKRRAKRYDSSDHGTVRGPQDPEVGGALRLTVTRALSLERLNEAPLAHLDRAHSASHTLRLIHSTLFLSYTPPNTMQHWAVPGMRETRWLSRAGQGNRYTLSRLIALAWVPPHFDLRPSRECQMAGEKASATPRVLSTALFGSKNVSLWPNSARRFWA